MWSVDGVDVSTGAVVVVVDAGVGDDVGGGDDVDGAVGGVVVAGAEIAEMVSGLVVAVVVADVDPGRVQAAVEASSARQHRARRPARAITRSVVVARARRSSAGCDRWIVGVEVRRASGPVGNASPELGGSDDLDLGPE